MTDNTTVYIDQLNIEPQGDGITAITLTAVYGDTKAEATIFLRPGHSVPGTEPDIRDQIGQLGEALQAAARSPHGINRGDFPGPSKEAVGR
jgi:hypothetical protein